MRHSLKTSASIVLFSTLALTSVSITQPKPAHAIVGGAAGSVPTAIVGASLLGAGALGLTVYPISRLCVAAADGSNNTGCGYFVVLDVGLGAVSGIIGLIVLADHSVSYGHLTAQQARAAELTAEQYEAYESSLPEISALSQQITTEAKSEEQARDLWIEYGADLPGSALDAVGKVSAHAVKQIRAAAHK